jgi:MFS family permease
LKPQQVMLVCALAFSVLTYAVSQMLLVPSLPTIQRALHVTPVAATSLLTAFFVSGAATVGIAGRLGDMFGKRRILLATLGIFTIGALIAALASTLPLLIAARVVMGCTVGIFPLAFSIVRDELPTAHVPFAIGLLGSFGAAGAVIGQVSGGLVTDGLGYHWVFWCSVFAGILALLATFAFVPESSTTAPGRVDLAGAVLLMLGLGAPLIGLSGTPTHGWAGTRTLVLFAAGIAILAVFVRHERRHSDPILDLPTLLLPRVRLANMSTFFVGFGLFGTSAIISQFVQMPRSTGYGLGASATAAGVFFVPGLSLMLLGSSLFGKLMLRFGAKAGLTAGGAIGTAALAGLAASHDSRTMMFVWPMFMYLGVALCFSAAPLIILGSVPAAMRGQTTGANVIMRNIGTAVGVQLAATIVTASAHGHGLAREGGYRDAFIVEAAAAGVATLLALTIPARPRALVAAAPLEAAIASERV